MMATQTITFNEVKLYGNKSVKCAGGCGRTLKRQRKFWQTLSPFNKNTDGELKSELQIRAELRNEMDQWQQQRHACAEAVVRIDRNAWSLDAAHGAVMNAEPATTTEQRG